eukprot:TRINITY_DN63116_c0_g1_i1.p1 TRINITY_DN63116_c0_g1~~TRINITY_DN63116_c0_g1_i1.p1  ORF type:complete len:234 (-),score=28.77 TRINITY_DN63116_c0_g1_i1:108-737(-)
MPAEVFGRIGHYEQYSYVVLKDYGSWSIRRYAPAVAAEASHKGNDSSQFGRLAKYIGVFSKPENVARGTPEPIAMTTPVISESIAMTVPVVSEGSSSQGCSMRFVLPSKYKTVDDAPAPTHPGVRLVDVPERFAAAIQFNGLCDGMDAAEPYHQELIGMMDKIGLVPAGNMELHRFNPPYTLSYFRLNEVLVPVTKDSLEKLGLDTNIE